MPTTTFNINMTDKNYREFLELLLELDQANLDFINGKDGSKIDSLKLSKYKEEIEKLQDLINSFDFMGFQTPNKKLISHAVPSLINSMFK